MTHQKENVSTQTKSGSTKKVWFITGSSRGFGRIWATAALERGDSVAATARNLESIADLAEKYGTQVLTLPLDVTKPDQVTEAIEHAHAHFGRIDIVLNNAGYSLVGTIEEADAAEVKAMYETNIFGALSVIKAALPLLRKQGGGHILGISSSLGHLTLPVTRAWRKCCAGACALLTCAYHIVSLPTDVAAHISIPQANFREFRSTPTAAVKIILRILCMNTQVNRLATF